MRKPYQVHAVREDTFLIDDSFQDHMYLVCGTKRALLIDTGMGEAGLRETVEGITKLPVTVLNTHGHLDHIGGGAEWKQVRLHPLDFELYQGHAGEACRREKIAGLLEEQGKEMGEEEKRKLLGARAGAELLPLEDGEVFSLGGRDIKVIHTPGHTPGSVCLLDLSYGFLYSADTVCGMGVMLSFPCSRPVSEFLLSLRKLKSEVSGIRYLFGGHHKAPLEPVYLDKYIACGERLLQGEAGSKPEKSVFGEFLRFPYEDISLAYTPDKLQ